MSQSWYGTMRLLFNALLFASIIGENMSVPTRTDELVMSSPAPFSLPALATTVPTTISPNELFAGLTPGPGVGGVSSDAPDSVFVTDPTLFSVFEYGSGNGAVTIETNNDETILRLVTPTAPTSVEQHDQPAVPSTTLDFAGSGNGMAATVDDSTPPYAAVDEKYVPSKPLNLTVLDVTANSITMSWHPPKNQNGAIAGYHVYHIHENQTGVEIVKNSRNAIESTINFVLPKLKPFTDYRIIVKAFTTKNEGESSDHIAQRTDVSGPSAPIVVNLTCHSQDAIALRWKRPSEFSNTIDFYIIKSRVLGQDSHRDIRINASAKELETKMILQNLTTNSVYEVKVAAATFSIINTKKIIPGKFSDARKILLQPNCEKIQPLLRQSHNDYNLAVLVGIIFSCFGIVLIVMAFFLWSRKCFHAAYYYLDDPPHHPNVPQVDWEVPVEVGGEIRAAVPVNEFAKHVASLHADGDIGFSREYEAIQNECVSDDLPCEHSQHPENKRKNRYLNITAYDHSRVHLHPTPGQKKNLDYINANFIDGYQKSRAFIGTQGPLPDTFDCFWRMIWEQRVAIIVMITNLVERGRRKCDMYWPKDGTETYGVIQVKLVEEEVMSTYTVRTLQIKHLKLKKKKQCNSEKLVYQYHYTNWPDHGTPDHPLPVLNFVKKSSVANPADAGPIVVHCSAGVGRTGTYIVLDAMLKQIQQKGVVNVFGFLRHIRVQRNFLVQTEEQYIFIHDALVEAIASGETNLRAEQIEELKNCTSYLEQQYKNIIQFQTKDIHIASAMKQVNSIKNRGAIFPIESSRVHLTPKPGEEGSDYINASWLHGFRRLRDFIVSQHPMTHTVKDFWQMVWDHNAQTIVLLSSLDEINFAQFWPDDSTPIESDYYRVKFLSKTNKSDYVSRDFVIQSIQDDYELNVKMLHCPSWPEMSNPNSIYDFIVDVHERCNDYRNGPIVVVDRYGGAQACTFCAISSLAIEMEYCNTANIYQYAKLYHNKRPGVWTSSEDIRLIFNILSYLPRNLQLLKRTALRTEFEDVTTATPDLYSKICSNGNVTKDKLNNCNFSQISHSLNSSPKTEHHNNTNMNTTTTTTTITTTTNNTNETTDTATTKSQLSNNRNSPTQNLSIVTTTTTTTTATSIPPPQSSHAILTIPAMNNTNTTNTLTTENTDTPTQHPNNVTVAVAPTTTTITTNNFNSNVNNFTNITNAATPTAITTTTTMTTTTTTTTDMAATTTVGGDNHNVNNKNNNNNNVHTTNYDNCNGERLTPTEYQLQQQQQQLMNMLQYQQQQRQQQTPSPTSTQQFACNMLPAMHIVDHNPIDAIVQQQQRNSLPPFDPYTNHHINPSLTVAGVGPATTTLTNINNTIAPNLIHPEQQQQQQYNNTMHNIFTTNAHMLPASSRLSCSSSNSSNCSVSTDNANAHANGNGNGNANANGNVPSAAVTDAQSLDIVG